MILLLHGVFRRSTDMSINYAVMVPHPPIILKEVGRGEEEKISVTTEAYERAAREIAARKPDVLIITSPHTILYADYFHVSPGEEAHGSMAGFRAPQVTFDVKYDDTLASYIEGIAEDAGFPMGTLGERDKDLDHGTMVPLYFILKELPDVKIVRIGLSGLSYEEHYLAGVIINKAVEELGRNACFVASGDLSHKQKEDGPYGLVPEGPEYDERIMDVMGRAAFDELFDFDERFCDKAAECGHRSFIMMAGALDGRRVEAESLSHEATFGVGYGIVLFTPGEADESRRFLYLRNEEKRAELKKAKENESALVKVARGTVESYISKRTVPDFDLSAFSSDEQAVLNRQAGAFVSIHKDGKLRGCIGTFLPTTENVYEEIRQNAVSASTRDPRFTPIRPDELASLEINVDVLSTPESIPDESYLDPKIYGVIVSSGMKRGLLLPDLEGVDTVEYQIEIAKQKAGIRDGEPIELERFKVDRYK